MKRKTENGGFSLYELFTVFVLLAALAAVIGIQAVSPLNRAKEDRDRQLIGLFAADAAEVCFASESLWEDGIVVVRVYTGSYKAGTAEERLQEKIRAATGYDTLEAFRRGTLSDRGRQITDINIMFDRNSETVTVQAQNGEEPVFSEAVFQNEADRVF